MPLQGLSGIGIRHIRVRVWKQRILKGLRGKQLPQHQELSVSGHVYFCGQILSSSIFLVCLRIFLCHQGRSQNAKIHLVRPGGACPNPASFPQKLSGCYFGHKDIKHPLKVPKPPQYSLFFLRLWGNPPGLAWK